MSEVEERLETVEPDDFLYSDPSTADEIDDPTQDAEEPESEEEESSEEDEELEEEPLEEEEEEPEEEKPKKKSRNARAKEKIIKLSEENESLRRQIAQRSTEPTARQLLSDPEFLSRLAQVKTTQEPTLPTVPERPKPPVRPGNFSRQRAFDEPDSADARYLDAREQYQDDLLAWQENKERVESEIKQIKTREYQEKQYQQQQEQIRTNLEDGIYESAKTSKYVPEGKATEYANAAIEWLSNPESLDADVLFKAYLLKNYKPPAKTKTPKKTKKKEKLPPPPAETTASRHIGWVDAPKDAADQFDEDIRGVI